MAILNGTNFNDNNTVQNGILRPSLNGTVDSDVINGFAGNDILTGNAGNDSLFGGIGDDLITGGTGDDLLNGGVGNDRMIGSSGNDMLQGGTGNDSLNGGAGKDLMFGGIGIDRYVFSTAIGTDNEDQINGFSSVDDTVVLENAIFTSFTSTGAIQAGNLVAAAGATAVDADDFLLYDSTTGALSYDADGSGAGAAIAFASLNGSPAVTAADFVVI